MCSQILSYIIFNLCIHPEYIERLRQESGSFQNSGDHEAIDNMPLLDSFIKESARLNPLDSCTLSSIFYLLKSYMLTLDSDYAKKSYSRLHLL